MKKLHLVSLLAISLSASPLMAADASLKTEEDKISYSIGVDIGKHFSQQDIKLNKKAFIKGLEHAQHNKPLLMTEEEMKTTLISLQNQLLEQQNVEREKLAMINLEEGKKFLKENKLNKNFKVTETGLQYRVIEEGQGTPPEATDKVTTHYRGRLIDGTEFDSSYSRGEPMQFTVNGVIPGWTEALQMMKPGAKWEIVVPPELAYGEHGVGNVIGPNAVLIFEIELLDIQKIAKS